LGTRFTFKDDGVGPRRAPFFAAAQRSSEREHRKRRAVLRRAARFTDWGGASVRPSRRFAEAEQLQEGAGGRGGLAVLRQPVPLELLQDPLVRAVDLGGACGEDSQQIPPGLRPAVHQPFGVEERPEVRLVLSECSATVYTATRFAPRWATASTAAAGRRPPGPSRLRLRPDSTRGPRRRAPRRRPRSSRSPRGPASWTRRRR